MFIHTRAVSKKAIDELRFFSDLMAFLLQFLYLGFLVFSLACGKGNAVVNTVLLCLSLSFFAFLLYAMISRRLLPKNEARKIKHAYRITLLLFRALALYITVYGIYLALDDINPVSMIFAAFMFVSWVLGVLFEIVRFIFERYTELLTSAIIKDTNPVVNLYNKVTFKHAEPREETKTDLYVEDITNEYKEELRTKKESKKARAEAERLIRRENRREALHNVASSTKDKLKSLFAKKENDEADDNSEND